MKNDNDITNLPIFVPVLTIDKFAKAIGVTRRVVTNWIDQGHIDTLKIGKRRVINIAAMTKELIL
ncbi:MAG: helix-turn-helix domain-containing protein [Cocleimonas sp.]|nr:helix-turn-helix domain-containing protein [Cocleimonas sp.]